MFTGQLFGQPVKQLTAQLNANRADDTQEVKANSTQVVKYGDLEISFPSVLSNRGYLNVILVPYEDETNGENGAPQGSAKNKKSKFPPDESYTDSPYQMRIPASKGLNRAVFRKIPYGKYAIAVIHDENSNSHLDYLLGFDLTIPPLPNWPIEGYGFSNPNPSASSFLLPPHIEKALIEVNGQKRVEVKMSYFWKRFGIFLVIIPMVATVGMAII